MTKIEKDRIRLKAAIVEQNLDMLDYEQMRGIYLATLQIAKYKERGDVQTVAFEIGAETYAEDKKMEVEKIARICFLMDANKLHRLYITALNML
ncbi:MAG: hypothetical protein ACLVCS_09915 [Christensenellaceae bacterium]